MEGVRTLEGQKEKDLNTRFKEERGPKAQGNWVIFIAGGLKKKKKETRGQIFVPEAKSSQQCAGQGRKSVGGKRK